MVDPLAQYRTSPAPPPAATSPAPKEPEGYVAFAGKDRAEYLEIRRAVAPFHAPFYRFHINTSFDGPYVSNFVIYFTILTVHVRGRNLKEVISAILKQRATFIQEFDPDLWPMPKDDKAPFIESINIVMAGIGPTDPDTEQTGDKPH